MCEIHLGKPLQYHIIIIIVVFAATYARISTSGVMVGGETVTHLGEIIFLTLHSFIVSMSSYYNEYLIFPHFT